MRTQELIKRIYTPSHVKELQSVNKTKNNKQSSAYNIIPFLADIFKISDYDLIKSYSKCIIELDNLAKQIDKELDTNAEKKNQSFIVAPSIQSFEGLDVKITDSFSYLVGLTDLENLISETMEAINVSFKYNTTDRHKIYNLSNTDYEGCTMYYLYPLTKYFCLNGVSKNLSKNLFFLMSNHIQLLDDFVDLHNDLELNIETPVTLRYSLLLNKPNSNLKAQSAFSLLVYEIINSLLSYFICIKKEIHQINFKNHRSLLKEWVDFNNKIKQLKLPTSTNRNDEIEYLSNIYKLIPPIICYTG